MSQRAGEILTGVRTVREALDAGTSLLKHVGIESPRLNAERLLGHAVGAARSDLYAHPERRIEPATKEHLDSLLDRRSRHEPLQYILGEAEFMSLTFRVTPSVLVPRPETEILVEAVIEAYSERPGTRILDVGTGSGCIAVSLAHYLPGSVLVGIDVSEDALAVARENAERMAVTDRMKFVAADIASDGILDSEESRFDVLVSNPPYVALDEWDALPREVREHEPRSALCDEGDGLSFYRLLVSRSEAFLKSDGRVFFEVGDRQGEKVQLMLVEAGYQDVVVHPDLNGTGRVVQGRWPGIP